MKKSILVLLVAFAMVSSASVHASLPSETEPLEFILGAGVTQFETGTVTVWLDGNDLFVHVETNHPWLLKDLHIIAVEDLGDIPVSNPVCLCPQFGHFPYTIEFDEPTDSHTAQIILSWDQQGPLYVMIHASVIDEDGESGETAFAHGENFGSTRFAYYITINPNGDDPNGDDPNGDDPNGDDPNGDDPNGDDPEMCYWYPHLSGLSNSLMAVAWNENLFVAVGESGSIFTSPTGEEWTARESGVTDNLFGAAWGNDIFVVTGRNGTVLTSADGITWQDNTPGHLGIDFLSDVVWNGDLFVVVGNEGTIITSEDGVNWALQTSGTTEFLAGVEWGGGMFMAVGSQGTILTSPDGVNWSAAVSGTTQMLYDVVWAQDMFVVVGGSSRIILTSDDGTNWDQVLTNDATPLRSVAWTGEEFVAVGGGGEIVSSADGEQWRNRTSGTSQQLNSIAIGGEQYLVVGAAGTTLLRICEVLFDDPLPELPETGTNTPLMVGLGMLLLAAGLFMVGRQARLDT